jgi:hypothetical protein
VYSSLPSYFLSFDASRRGIPLTLVRRNVTNMGEARETRAKGTERAGAHRLYIDHQVTSSPKSSMDRKKGREK